MFECVISLPYDTIINGPSWHCRILPTQMEDTFGSDKLIKFTMDDDLPGEKISKRRPNVKHEKEVGKVKD